MFPAQSEVLLVALYLEKNHSAVTLVAVATCGNMLGACVNWWLGNYLEHFKNRRWFPVKQKGLDAASRTYQRYGVWTLLFSWVPFIGDQFTLIAGFLRTPFGLFFVLVLIGKLARYVALVYAF